MWPAVAVTCVLLSWRQVVFREDGQEGCGKTAAGSWQPEGDFPHTRERDHQRWTRMCTHTHAHIHYSPSLQCHFTVFTQVLTLCLSVTGTTTKEITSNIIRSVNWTTVATTSPRDLSLIPYNSWWSTTQVAHINTKIWTKTHLLFPRASLSKKKKMLVSTLFCSPVVQALAAQMKYTILTKFNNLVVTIFFYIFHSATLSGRAVLFNPVLQ